MLLHQLGQHLVECVVGIADFLSGLDVAQVDDFDFGPVVEELVEGLADIVGTISAAVVVDGTAFFLDADEGQLIASQLGEILLIAVDGEGFPEGVLTGTDVGGEALVRHRL